MRIGFTGTRNGLTMEQENSLMDVLAGYSFSEFHHGDCFGSDAEAHGMVVTVFRRDTKIVIHPGYSVHAPADTSMRAFCDGDEIRQPKSYFARNRDIVNETDVLIATPPSKPLPLSGGTAYTVGYAQGQNKTVVIIYPDGEVG